MTSLGQKLAQQQREEAERLAREEARRLAEERAEQDRKEQLVQEYFDSIRGTVESVILHGGKMPEFTIGKRGGWVRDSFELSRIMETFRSEFPSNVENPNIFYGAIWRAFRLWAQQNDLEVDLVYNHDGMGVESWYVVTVKPRAGV
jgi:hypothetical protein